MASVDLTAVNEELMKAQEKHDQAVLNQLTIELKKKTVLDQAKNAAAAAPADGKTPSEAACERIAKQDPTYRKLCEDEISAIGGVLAEARKVGYLQRKFSMFLALMNKEK